MFIERLTKEDLKNFFTDAFSLYCYMDSEICSGKKYLYCSFENSHEYTENKRMYDYEGSTVSDETKWRKFLYSLFGEEYKIAYGKYLDEQKELKLAELN